MSLRQILQLGDTFYFFTFFCYWLELWGKRKEGREERRRWIRGKRRGRRKVERWRKGWRKGRRRVQRRVHKRLRSDFHRQPRNYNCGVCEGASRALQQGACTFTRQTEAGGSLGRNLCRTEAPALWCQKMVRIPANALWQAVKTTIWPSPKGDNQETVLGLPADGFPKDPHQTKGGQQKFRVRGQSKHHQAGRISWIYYWYRTPWVQCPQGE